MPRSTRVDSASRLIHASPDAIYGAFVNPRTLVHWLPPTGMTARINVFDLREGGEYCITLTYVRSYDRGRGKSTAQTDVTEGRFLELLPGRRIVQSVQFRSDDPAVRGEMRLTWTFEPAAEGTNVTISAENVPLAIPRADHEAGFKATLDNLAACVEPPKEKEP